MMDEKKVGRYLEKRGLVHLKEVWSIPELKAIIKDIRWDGEECGYLVFKISKSGRKYIQFVAGRCYID